MGRFFEDGRSRRGRSRVAVWAERCLWLLGIAALGYTGFEWGQAVYSQAQGNRELDSPLSMEELPGGETGNPPDGNRAVAEGSLMGRIAIPDVGLSAVVFEGSSDKTLDRGVGHLAGSVEPGHRGNVVLAGHRDTFFRPLRDIRPGHEIAVTTRGGVYRYTVTSTEVVGPRQTEVLAWTPGKDVTLITCYPFRYVGSAPDRFVVYGRAVE